MFIENTLNFHTNEVNSILNLLDFDELRQNHVIEFKEKTSEELHYEASEIRYGITIDEIGNPVVSAVIKTHESYSGLLMPIKTEVKLNHQEILDVITEYFSWRNIPYQAREIKLCTNAEENKDINGKEDIGRIEVVVEKIFQKKRKKVNI